MFQNLEITSSNPGTEKEPKYPLSKWWVEKELVRLDNLVQMRTAVNLDKKYIIRYQIDGAGLHQDKKLLDLIDREFSKRGWMFRF